MDRHNPINSIPNWLFTLTQDKFFTACSIHKSLRKNEKNTLCLDCCTSLCPHCLPHHHTHILLQIRRYMYKEVIRLGDAQRLLNCSSVQPYITNRAKVVFLKRRTTSSSCVRGREPGNLCIECDRSLQEPYIFCSLSCKVRHLQVIITKSATNTIKQKHELSVVRSSENPEDSRVTPDSVLDYSPTSTSTCSSWGVGDNVVVELVPRIWCTPTVSNRRKGVPHRSPLY